MALPAYLTILPERHPPILGSVTQKGREGKILVVAASHEIVSPRDPASGRSTGKRVHKPFVCTKEVDRATPLLFTLLTENENIREARIEFWTPSPTGLEKLYYTVTLTNATICAINVKMPNNRVPKLANRSSLEAVGFVYQKIMWTWTDGGVSASDDWETPRT
jgi:type VI secretion system secreted protein Hcp